MKPRKLDENMTIGEVGKLEDIAAELWRRTRRLQEACECSDIEYMNEALDLIYTSMNELNELVGDQV